MMELKEGWEMRRELDGAAIYIVGLWISILMFVTAPIWGIPYLLYKKVK